MLRSETDVAHVVLALVIKADRVAAGLGAGLVEPELRAQSAQCLDAHHGGALALVLHRGLDIKTRVAQMLVIALAGDVVGVDTVMRQIQDGLRVAVLRSRLT